MADGLAGKVQGLMDGVEDNTQAPVAEMRKALKKYIDAEGKILPAVQKMNAAAAGILVKGLDKVMNAKGPAGDAVKKRKRDFDAVNAAFEAFTDALDGIVEGTGGGGKAAFPGEQLQQLLDRIEFTDKSPLDDLRAAAKAYYPLESAGRKKLQEWAVHLGYLIEAANRGLEALDAGDQVDALNLNFGRTEVIKPAIDLKAKIAAFGV